MILNKFLNILPVLACLLFLSMPAAGFAEDEQEQPQQKQYYSAIIKLSDGYDVDELTEQGCVVYAVRENLALVGFPRAVAESLSETGLSGPRRREARNRKGGKRRSFSGIERIEFADTGVMLLDSARMAMGANRLLDGSAFGTPYSGKGVVVGMCDIGFDPMHPTFLTPDGNSSRIAKVVQFIESEGKRVELTGVDQYKEWKTDNAEHTHGTHVAGILAGACNAEGFRGIADQAEIVASVSELTFVGLLAGAEEILAYAKEQKKPCVINMSMGSYTGPHDGTSLFSQYLDMIGREAIVCMSAGNEGRHTNAMTFYGTGENKRNGFRLANYSWTNFHMTGSTDVWADNNSTVSLYPVVYDEYSRKVMVRLGDIDQGGEQHFAVSSDPDSEWYNEEFAKYYTGWIEVFSEINPDNNRFNITAYYDAETSVQSPSGKWARYNIAFEATAPEGVRVDVYADGTQTFLKQYPGGAVPSADNSISDMCCGQNVISVGMYDSRQSTPLISGNWWPSSNPTGIVNPNSSYGTLVDGRVLPLTVAPGADVVSACNYYYAQLFDFSADAFAAKGTTADGDDYYWVMDLGTSMSSPYVAGFMALWLEACPELTSAEAIQFITKSNSHEYPDPENPRHGLGWFNPVEGMRLVHGRISTGSISNDIETLTVRQNLGGLCISGAQRGVTATVCDISGRIIACGITDEEGQTQLNLPENCKGPVIVRVGCSTAKVAVR